MATEQEGKENLLLPIHHQGFPTCKPRPHHGLFPWLKMGR